MQLGCSDYKYLNNLPRIHMHIAIVLIEKTDMQFIQYIATCCRYSKLYRVISMEVATQQISVKQVMIYK